MARVKTKSGAHLTKKMVEGLAAKAEKGYDLSKAKAEATRGRPSLGRGVSPRITYRVPARLYSKAKARAKSEGRTVSEVARGALERYISE